MLLTGHKSRAIFDRYNIIHEQELLDAGDQPRRVSRAAGRRRCQPVGGPNPAQLRRPAHRITPSPCATHHRVRLRGGPPARARGRWRLESNPNHVIF